VWKLLFEEVRKVTLGGLGGSGMDDSQLRDKDEETTGQSDDDPWEEERSWRDPSAHNVRRAVILWDNFEKGRNRLVRVNFILIVQKEGIKFPLLRSRLLRNSSTLHLTNTNSSPPCPNARRWWKSITENLSRTS
jgi:hypothetical protein